MKMALEDGTDREFRNVVVSQPKPNAKTKKYISVHDESLKTRADVLTVLTPCSLVETYRRFRDI
jgi:hypothetical protein